MQTESKSGTGFSVLHPGAVAGLVGFTAVTAQIVAMREVMVLYNGNELSLGIVLAAWMIWTAVGSGLIGRFSPRPANLGHVIAVLQCVAGPILLVTMCVLRASRAYLQTVPGELLGPVPIALVTMTSLSILCILSGTMFALAARMYSNECRMDVREASSYAYFLETAGSAVGGILTSVLLLRYFASFQIVVIVTAVNMCVASLLLFGRLRARIAVLGIISILTTAALVKVAPWIESATRGWIWQGFSVIGSRETIYGQITLLNAGGMHSLYENGAIVANVPDRVAAEETIHFAMLEHLAPRSVLLIGGGTNGSIVEALKHPTLERLDYVELDPELIAMYREFFPGEAEPAFSDPRVHVHLMDGRLYLKSSREQFDEIIVSTPDPDTTQLNRFYTVEFFQLARDHLAPGGVFALQLRSSEESIGTELREFLQCIHKGLEIVFPDVAVIPGETVHMLGAAKSGVLTEDPEVLVSRLKNRRIETMYARDYAIRFRMMPDRMDQIRAVLQGSGGARINRDFGPVAYYFGTVFWSAQFKSGYAQALEAAARIPFWIILLFVTALSVSGVLLWAAISRRRVRPGAGWSVGATGFTLMMLQMLLILAFQSVYGFVYHELAMLIGMFMAGIAVGTFVGIRHIQKLPAKAIARAAAINQALLAFSAPLLIGTVGLLVRDSMANEEVLVSVILFPAAALVSGALGGYQFPLASQLWQRGKSERTGYGTLYALDLLGGSVGAIALAGFLIPLFGFWSTAWICALVNTAPALILLLARTNLVTTSR